MSAPGNQAVAKPALLLALLAVFLGVGMNVFEGTVRTAVIIALGAAIVVTAGFAGAAVKRARQ
ncbi:hypothetical protein [Streptomyces sp. NPDC058657]|uniref:hypothetical protein n=1 Tax=unclassified Streptomyces TaxID=2593676 RepID=UPI00365853C6